MHPLPLLTTAQRIEVDRILIEEYHIDPLQIMENAGRNLALLAKRVLDEDVVDRPVVVLAGRGNNGGGGLAAARHLLNWGAWVQVLLTHPPDAFTGAPARQLRILEAMGEPFAWAEEGWELPPADLVIDALIGEGLQGDPQGVAANLIRLANSSMAPILSLAAPSGLDTTDGTRHTPHINAAATLSLALPSVGLVQPAAQSAVGQLYLADISVPPALYEHIGIAIQPLFAEDTVIALHVENGVAYTR